MDDSYNNSGDTPEELYNQGIEYLQRHSWEEAAATFKRLNLIAPGYRDAWKRLIEAKENARHLEDLEDLYNVSKAHLEKKQWKHASDCLRSLVDSDERYKDAAGLLKYADRQLTLQTKYAEATAQLELEKWKEAIEVLEEIVRIDQAYEDSQAKLDNAQAQHRLQNLYNQALDHLHKEDWDEAIETLETVCQEDPDYPGATDKLKEAQEQQGLAALYRAGVGFQETGKWKEAIDQFREIVHQAGVYKDVAHRLLAAQKQQKLDRLFGQGENCLCQGKWEEAVRQFEEVYEMAPNYRSAQARLEEAKRQLRLEELYERGEATFHDENWQEAAAIFKEMHELNPKDGSVIAKLEEANRQVELDELYREGMKHLRKKRWRKARTALEKIILVDRDYRDAEAQLKIVQEHLARSNSFIGLLRDPIMQGFGFIITLIALIITIYTLIKGNSPNRAMPTPTPATLCNGDFEGNFACWQSGGELNQTVECDGNQCYAVLGNPDYPCEGGVPVGAAWIKQAFQVPETVSPTFSLRYRIFSYDLDTYDFFRVSIDSDPVIQDGNTEWDTSSCDREVWDSDWRSVEFDLSPYIGEEVELSLYNINGEHESWNTWTHVDDVEIH